jgi:hypothetical protein
MTGPAAGRDGGGDDTFEALRSMIATMFGGAGLLSGQLGRVPAVGEVGRAFVLMPQALSLAVTATATHARAGVRFVQVAGRGTSLAFGLARAMRPRR